MRFLFISKDLDISLAGSYVIKCCLLIKVLSLAQLQFFLTLTTSCLWRIQACLVGLTFIYLCVISNKNFPNVCKIKLPLNLMSTICPISHPTHNSPSRFLLAKNPILSSSKCRNEHLIIEVECGFYWISFSSNCLLPLLCCQMTNFGLNLAVNFH